MGWSDKSHYMRSIYTRGSELQFAAEVNLPSMVSIWHAGQTPTVPSFAHGPPERRDGPAAHQQQRRAKGGPSRAELLACLNELSEVLAATDV